MTKLQQKVENYLNQPTNENFNIVLQHYDKKFNYTSSRWGTNQEDIYQELCMCLHKSLESYNPNKNVLFNTFFWHCWHNHAGSIKIRKQAKKRIDETKVLYLNAKMDSESEDEHQDQIEDKKQKYVFEEKANRIDFYRFLENTPNISKREKQILEKYYELGNMTEVAREIGVSTPAIHHALKTMRTRPFAQKLYDCLKGAVK